MKSKRVLNWKVHARISGIVSSGLEEHMFLWPKSTIRAVLSLMGKPVWPGTLNLKVSGSDLSNYIALRMKSGIDTLDADDVPISAAKEVQWINITSFRIRGFLQRRYLFRWGNLHKAIFKSNGVEVDCSVLIPDLTIFRCC